MGANNYFWLDLDQNLTFTYTMTEPCANFSATLSNPEKGEDSDSIRSAERRRLSDSIVRLY